MGFFMECNMPYGCVLLNPSSELVLTQVEGLRSCFVEDLILMLKSSPPGQEEKFFAYEPA